MKYIVFIIIALIFCDVAFCQGLILDDEEIIQSKLDRTRTDQVPLAASLKSLAPHTLLQQNSTCVAYSIATARTMLYARNHRLSDIDSITAYYYSPHWIYYRNKDGNDTQCSNGLSFEPTLINVMDQGVTRLAFVEYPDFYPFTEITLCNSYPPIEKQDSLDAKEWGLDEVFVLKNLEDVKLAIAKSYPVVFGMKIPDSFEDQLGKELWTPLESDKVSKLYGHAMVIVGYDDYKYGGAVEVLNSWGAEWGKGGYIWIKYDDIIDYITTKVFALEKKGNDKFGRAITNPETDFLLQMDIKNSSKNKEILPLGVFSSLKSKFHQLNIDR